MVRLLQDSGAESAETPTWHCEAVRQRHAGHCGPRPASSRPAAVTPAGSTPLASRSLCSPEATLRTGAGVGGWGGTGKGGGKHVRKPRPSQPGSAHRFRWLNYKPHEALRGHPRPTGRRTAEVEGGATKGIVGERLLPFLWRRPSGRQVGRDLRLYPWRIAPVFSHPGPAAPPPLSSVLPRAFSQDAGWSGRGVAAAWEACGRRDGGRIRAGPGPRGGLTGAKFADCGDRVPKPGLLGPAASAERFPFPVDGAVLVAAFLTTIALAMCFFSPRR